MKKILFLMLLVAILGACKKEDSGRGKVRPEAPLNLNIVEAKKPGLKTNPLTEHLSPLEIVKETYIINFISEEFGLQERNHPYLPYGYISRGFGPEMRDTVNMKLKMYSTDVIKEDGSLMRWFIEAKDVILVNLSIPPYIPPSIRMYYGDTLAYIPNATLRSIESRIKAAYNAGDYQTCYSIMDNEFVFTPITGSEYRALKARGEN